MCKDSSSGAWNLHGVTSFGAQCEGYAVFARVTTLLPWIENIMNGEGECCILSINIHQE